MRHRVEGAHASTFNRAYLCNGRVFLFLQTALSIFFQEAAIPSCAQGAGTHFGQVSSSSSSFTSGLSDEIRNADHAFYIRGLRTINVFYFHISVFISSPLYLFFFQANSFIRTLTKIHLKLIEEYSLTI